jgi:LmbE family N-acetylglucosaminyl deacetylase
VAETHASAEILGVSRVAFLDYLDSGMIGTPENDVPGSFWQADVEKAAGELAAILIEEGADVVTAYDENGVYGHPDHIQVHRVGLRAARLAGTPKAYMSTANRDHIRRGMEQAATSGVEMPGPPEDMPDPSELRIGVPEDRITTVIDARDYIDVKRRSMVAHASQISETSFFLAMPPDMFTEAFGREWYMLEGAGPGTRETDLLEGL